VVALSTGALGDAEATLGRLRERQQADDDLGEALAALEGASAPGGVEVRLSAEGYGRRRTDPKAVLQRLKASA
jgi:hypothetical protein